MKNLTFLIGKLRSYSAFLISAFILSAAFVACESAPPQNSRSNQIQRGKVLFDKYCISCHADKGNGPAADTLEVKPADLTRIIARRKGNDFPVMEIARYIDGRQFISAHGTRAMPIWGDVFATEENMNETEIKGKLGELIAYLISIQE